MGNRMGGRGLRVVAVAAACLALWTAAPRPAAALCASIREPTVIFDGRAVERLERDGGLSVPFVFEVEAVERGEVGPLAEVHIVGNEDEVAPDGTRMRTAISIAVGPLPEVGQRYRVGAVDRVVGGEPRLSASSCGGSLEPLPALAAPAELPRTGLDGRLLGALLVAVLAAGAALERAARRVVRA